MERYYSEILAYCAENIENFAERLTAAFDDIYRYHAPLNGVAPGLESEMWDCIEEFCEDNDLDAEDIYIEDLIRYE